MPAPTILSNNTCSSDLSGQVLAATSEQPKSWPPKSPPSSISISLKPLWSFLERARLRTPSSWLHSVAFALSSQGVSWTLSS